MSDLFIALSFAIVASVSFGQWTEWVIKNDCIGSDWLYNLVLLSQFLHLLEISRREVFIDGVVEVDALVIEVQTSIQIF